MDSKCYKWGIFVRGLSLTVGLLSLKLWLAIELDNPKETDIEFSNLIANSGFYLYSEGKDRKELFWRGSSSRRFTCTHASAVSFSVSFTVFYFPIGSTLIYTLFYSVKVFIVCDKVYGAIKKPLSSDM